MAEVPYLRTERQSDGKAEVLFIDNGKSMRFVVPPEGKAGGMTPHETAQALREARAAAQAFIDFVDGHLHAHGA